MQLLASVRLAPLLRQWTTLIDPGRYAVLKPTLRPASLDQPGIDALVAIRRNEGGALLMSTMTRLQNMAYWTKIVESSNLAKDLAWLSKLALATANGEMKKSQFVSGPGGIGKSHNYTKVFDETARPYERIKAGSILGLLTDLERCARKGKVALIEDPSPKIIVNPEFQLVLMAATGPEPRLYPYSVMGKRHVYNFKDLIIVLQTNLSFDGKGKVSDVFQALLTRVWSCTIQATRQELFFHACYLAICHGILRSHGVNLKKANVALEYFAENMHLLPDVSTRTLVKIVEMMAYFPNDWREGMDRERVKTKLSQPYTGEIPRIIPASAG